MVGRPYTMKEMKQIVDYLVEHRAYNEVKGRKMWIDLANSKLLDRTWQSLKETFLKRILPDICNTYYKLADWQIASFREGHDCEAKYSGNKLEIQPVDISSSTSGTDNQRAIEKTLEKELEKTGEDKCSKIQNRTRSSTETLVLENCYETAEDIQKELESPKTENQKSFRDFITYSEPLTPMLQEVLHDFSSDDEPQMQIVEEPDSMPKTDTNKTDDNNSNKPKSPETIRESCSYTKTTEKITNGEVADQKSPPSKIKSLKLKKTRKGTWENKEPVDDVSSAAQEKETNNNDSNMVFTDKENLTNSKLNNTEKTVIPDKNQSNSTTDTPLPNNQEELAGKVDEPNRSRNSTESSNSEFVEPRKKKKDKSRKRSHSQSSIERKKKKKDKSRDSSETREVEKNTQTFDSHPHATTLQKNLITETQNVQEDTKINQTDDTNIPPNAVVEDTTAKSNEGTSQEAGPSGVNPADINPCLKSVSLFEEQFSQSKYSDSEDEAVENHDQAKTNKDNHGNDNKETNQTKDAEETAISNKSNDIDQPTTSKNLGFEDVVLLKSHSETSSEQLEIPKKRNPVNRRNKSKEQALAQLFGFSSGGVTHKRTVNHSKNSSRRYSHRHRINSRTYNLDSGSSDDYTTCSDSDDPPPASSRNNEYRRYVKPSPFDILSHENGLFVVGRKKIYPLLLRENGTLHYGCTTEGNIDEEADSYWKTKYLEEKQKLTEEKIRADELARLLRKARDIEQAREATSPILQSNQSLTAFVNKNQQKQANETVTEASTKPEERIKIKFNRNKDIELEGTWTNINPILEKMVGEIFKRNDAQDAVKTNQETDSKTDTVQKENDEIQTEKSAEKTTAKTNTKSATKRNLSRKTNAKEIPTVNIRDSNDKDSGNKIDDTVTISSGKSTPMVITPTDSETRQKVDKLEKEIFEKIAAIDQADESTHETTPNKEESDTNVTKRKRGRPKKITALQDRSSSASLDTAPKKRAASIDVPRKSRASSIEKVAKKARTISEGPDVNPPEVESDAGPSKRSSRAPRRYGSDGNLAAKAKPIKTRSKLSLKADEPSKAEVSIPEDDHVRYMFPPAKTKKTKDKSDRRYSIIEQRLTSPDTSSRHSESTQYQDSDISPPNVTKRRKKMSTLALVHKKGLIRRVKRKSCPYLADDDSCSTTESQSQKSVPNDSQTMNSEVYRSESYQMLMPKVKHISQLDKIDELPTNETETNKHNLNNLTPLTINVNNEFYIPSNELQNNSRLKGSEANSSNISLPISPEISLVEHLSISKDLISSSLEEPPSTETLENVDSTNPNKFLISNIDVSMPLMGQECGIQTRHKNKTRNRRATFSESLEQEQYSSESLDQKLRDLLLESAKKMVQERSETAQMENLMEVDTIVASEKKARAKKRRSSTPCKKKTVPRSKNPDVDPVIEEHTESCSQSARKSCPPVIHVLPCEDATVTTETDKDNETIHKPERGRRKKDVIKVKILRPRSVSCSKEKNRTSRQSICTDSGINETESGVSDACECCDITTELIHNHSDTCLHIDECIGDSIELIEDGAQSVISLNSNSIPSDIPKTSKDTSEEFVTPEMFDNNAQDGTNMNAAKEQVQIDVDDVATVYHTPPSGGSFNSIITDDLSDENKPSHTKWYLLAEQDTNFADTQFQTCNTSVGSNLNKIFTSCAVPDLSTISERSKENDTKTVINTDTESDAISQSLFEFDF